MNRKHDMYPFPLQYDQRLLFVEKGRDGYGMPIDTFSAVVNGERLVIPSRIYERAKTIFKGRDQAEEQMWACWFSRHHNGFVREDCLRFLLRSRELRSFSIPYILKLAEEYVVELAELILSSFAVLPGRALSRFVRENPAWIPLMQQRCRSYWNCYYRNQYPCFEEYPGRLIIENLYTVSKGA